LLPHCDKALLRRHRHPCRSTSSQTALRL
jgi:hypothetical protein